jgi:REP-associated tyrosine transposase
MAECDYIRAGKWYDFKIMYACSAFVARCRHAFFAARHVNRIQKLARDACADFECEPAEFRSEPGRVHPLASVPPTVAISRLARTLNGAFSRRLRQEFPELRRQDWRA